MFERTLDRLAQLGGADIQTLRGVPQERMRLARTGLTLCSGSLMASISMAAALHIAFRIPDLLALVGGLVWAVCIILPLDAYLIVSLRRQKTSRQTIVSAIPRLVLALLIGTTVSIPLTLLIFSPEIHARIGIDEQAQIAAFESRLNSEPEYAQIPKLEMTVTELQTIIETGAVPANYSDPFITQLTGRVNTLNKEYAEAEATAACEERGTCGSHKSGKGPIYAIDSTRAAELLAALNNAQNQLSTAEEEQEKNAESGTSYAIQNARTQLPVVNSELSKLKTSQMSALSNEQKNILSSGGLIASLVALWQLSIQYPEVLFLHLLIIGLLIAIESCAVLMKVISLLGDETPYEAHVRFHENLQRTEAENELQYRRSIQSEVARVQKNQVVEAQSRITKRLMDIWEARELQKVEERPDDYLI